MTVEIEFLDDAEHVALLTMIAERGMNPLSNSMFEALGSAFSEVSRSNQVRAVVLRSAGEHFSAGADLAERSASSHEEILAARAHSRSATAAVLACPVPVIAAVHGYALGGGCELAMLCDIVVAADDAVFGLPETAIGIVPGAGGTQLIARRVGLTLASDMLLSGRRLTADEAVAVGLIARMTSRAELDSAAFALATEIADRSPSATRGAKAALNAGLSRKLGAALEIEDEYWRAAAVSSEYREGLSAFTEKRVPRF